jgi:hypothetical protein
MSTPFDPIAEKRAMQYSKKELDAIFKDKGSGKVATKLMTENPALYKVMRKEYEAQGGIGASAFLPPAPYTTGKPQKSYTDRELFLRAKYSLAELTTFFQSNKSNNPGNKEETPSTLFLKNRVLYEEMREAAACYGFLPSQPSTPSRTPQARTTEPEPGSGATFELDPRICKELSLPEGFRVNQEGYFRAIQAVKNAAASKAVAAEKARLELEAAANNPDNEGQ